MSVADTLRSLPSDRARAQYCIGRAEKLRDEYYELQAASVAYVRHSKSHQFDFLNDRARVLTGEKRWSESTKAKEILSDQKMFERWANMYNMSALSGVLT